MARYRVRRGLFGKSVLQRWACYPTGISSSLAGTCDWIDVDYRRAPAELEAVDGETSSRTLEIIDSRIDAICERIWKEEKDEKQLPPNNSPLNIRSKK